MLSNYPPGVTGAEPEIAGYDDEEDELPACEVCGSRFLVVLHHGLGRDQHKPAAYLCTGCWTDYYHAMLDELDHGHIDGEY